MEPVLAVKDLQVAFSDDKGRSISVDRISFQVNPGEVVCLVGESGCGKSVTSLAVMGLLGRPYFTRSVGRDALKTNHEPGAFIYSWAQTPHPMGFVQGEYYYQILFENLRDHLI